MADFVGSPAINLLEMEGKNVEKGIRLSNPDPDLLFVSEEPLRLRQPGKLPLGLRPEMVTSNPAGALDAQVHSSLGSGMETIVRFQRGGTALTSAVFGSIDFSVNETVGVSLDSKGYALFEASGERLAVGRLEAV